MKSLSEETENDKGREDQGQSPGDHQGLNEIQ